MSSIEQSPILVTGGSGHLAGLVISELLSRGVPAREIITTTRTPDKLGDLAARGVRVRRASFKEPEGLAAAFTGAARVLIISTIGTNRYREHKAAIDAALAQNVGQIFYTSGPNPEPPHLPVYWTQDHYETEMALIDSGVGWTVLRQWLWPDFHFAGDWTAALHSGELYTARGAGRVSYVTREDCAAAMAGALVAEDSVNRRYDLTGPAALSAEDIALHLSEAFGKKVVAVDCTVQDLEAHYLARGLAPAALPFLLSFNEGARLGRFDGVTDWVRRLSGRTPAPLKEFLRQKRAAAGVQAHA